MPIQIRHIAGEIGAASAVLALYLLVLLAPLHQASGLQRDLALVGFESSHSWSVCTSVESDSTGDETPTAAKCPLVSVGKSALPLPLAPTDVPSRQDNVSSVQYRTAESLPVPGLPDHPGQPRGPPARA